MTSEYFFLQEGRKLLGAFQMVNTCNLCVVTATYCLAVQMNINKAYTLVAKKAKVLHTIGS